MINLSTIVMKMARRVCNGKDCGFGPDPAFTNGEARGKVGPWEKCKVRTRGLKLTEEKECI